MESSGVRSCIRGEPYCHRSRPLPWPCQGTLLTALGPPVLPLHCAVSLPVTHLVTCLPGPFPPLCWLSLVWGSLTPDLYVLC